MTIFKRVRDIISASINELLAEIEDPEKMVHQMIREMEQSIAEVRKSAASSIGTQKMVERRLLKARKEKAGWQENAQLAIKQGNDELAKKALKKKRSYNEVLRALETELTEQKKIVSRIKDELRLVEEKVQETRMKRETLATKKRAAETKRRLIESMEKANKNLTMSDGGKIINGFTESKKLEDDVERDMAETEAERELLEEDQDKSLDEEFSKMKEEQALEEELKALKKKKGK